MPDMEEMYALVRRLADRLRILSDARLRQPAGAYASRADAAYGLAQQLADLAQGVEERDAPDPPAWRNVPRIDDLAAGDQVAVTGYDAAAALVGVPGHAEIWTRTGRRVAGESVASVLAGVRAVKDAIG